MPVKSEVGIAYGYPFGEGYPFGGGYPCGGGGP